jgi:hypothetical protein
LGSIQFWRGEVALIKALEPLYEAASRRGEQIVLGEKVSQGLMGDNFVKGGLGGRPWRLANPS